MKNEYSDRWYQQNYNKINASADEKSVPFKYLHNHLERRLPSGSFDRILEIGANNGEHLPFVTSNWNEYICSDIRMPANEKIEYLKKLGAKFEIADVQNLYYQSSSFDRIISTCVFHHLDDPLAALAEIRRVVKPGGCITLLLPNDPGIAYRLARNLTTIRKARQVNLEDEVEFIHSIEHRNHFLSLLGMIKKVFESDQIKFNRFPNFLPYWQVNLMTQIVIIRNLDENEI